LFAPPPTVDQLLLAVLLAPPATTLFVPVAVLFVPTPAPPSWAIAPGKTNKMNAVNHTAKTVDKVCAFIGLMLSKSALLGLVSE
jgi:hypothetical protein